MDTLISPQDQARIREAVHAAEGHTAGEIVPYLMPASGSYPVAQWRGAAIGALLLMGTGMALQLLYEGWGLGWLYTSWGSGLLALAGGALGALLASRIAPVKRWLAGADLLDRTVHHRALRAFVEEEVFNTRDRTGILLFISLLEHRIEVIGDAGINQKVEPDDWAEVVARVQRGLEEGNLADGLVDAIQRCGALLARKGVEIRPDDTNELPDQLRFRRDD